MGIKQPILLFVEFLKSETTGLLHIKKFDIDSAFPESFGYVSYDEYCRVVEPIRRENEELKAFSEQSRQDINSLLAKLDKAKWQPIETAPKDGTHILAWNYEGRFYLPPYICWFGQDMNEQDKNKREWLTGDGDDFSTGYYYTPCKPTHWMLLPDAPEQR